MGLPQKTPQGPSRLFPTFLLLLGVVGATGLALIMRYDADPSAAHAAVERVAAGSWGLVRGGHAWAASFVVALFVVHLSRVWVQGTPEARPAAWWTGLGIGALLLFGLLTGGILAWDQQGWESLQHVAAGPPFYALDPVHPEAVHLSSVFWLHVVFIPALLLPFLVLRLYLLGFSWPGMAEARLVLHRVGLPAAGWSAVTVALAWAAPPAHGPVPIPGLAVSRPDWPFLWLVPIQDAVGLWGLPLALLVGGAVLASFPWLGSHLSKKARQVSVLGLAMGVAALSAWAMS